MISVAKYKYLISITRKHQVATIRGYPVYVVSEVALTPCASQKEANYAVEKTAEQLRRRPAGESADDYDESDDEAAAVSMTGSDDVDENSEAESSAKKNDSSKSSIAQDVISRRGSYGRFAQRWFSKAGWMQDQKRLMGLSDKAIENAVASDEPKDNLKKETQDAQVGKPIKDEDTADSSAVSLLPKLLRTSQILFGSSRSFFFSYDYDITRSVATQPRDAKWQDMPLHKLVDPLYFWNSHVIKPFTDAGYDSLALPLMQGFVGQRTFIVDSDPPETDEGGTTESVEMKNFSKKQVESASQAAAGTAAEGSAAPETPPSENPDRDLRPSERKFVVTVISRRSTKRAGLRYMRRGIDEEGNVANAVETEQILAPEPVGWESKVFSFVQTRGSIPLFFTQTPYSLKPAAVVQHSVEANYKALHKHFDTLRSRYGSVQIVNLVEKHGVEAKIGTQFESSVRRLNEESKSDQQVPFEWFDFHDACKGMKFENVSLLLDTLGRKIASFGSTLDDGGNIAKTQAGVLRTNCMDCLDRTNVCQSSFAKFVLDAQLKEQGFDMTLQKDQENSWFNTLWADNGDAVSKQYASTGAMKGDYTRTRKRDYRGALTDAGLSLTRLFNGYVQLDYESN
jgi:hypothetical protein